MIPPEMFIEDHLLLSLALSIDFIFIKLNKPRENVELGHGDRCRSFSDGFDDVWR